MKMRIFLLSVGIALCSLLSASAQETVDSHFIDGVQEFTAGRYAEAVKLMDRAISSDRNNDAAYYYKAMAQMYLGQKDEALDNYRRAASIDTSNYWYRDRLAYAYSVSGRIVDAEKEYESLIKAFPGKLETYYTLVNIYIGRNELDKAVDAISAIENLQGKTDGTVTTKYQILLHQQRQEEALESLKEYSREYSSPQVLAMLGDHETGMSNDSLAIAYFDQALALDSSYTPAILGKAEVYRLGRKYPEYFSALTDFVASSDIPSPEKVEYLDQLFQHLDPRFIQAHMPQLDTTVRTMVRTHPSDTAALKTAGIYYFSTGRPEKAKETFRANRDANPDNFEAQAYYIQVLSSMNDYPALSAECESAAARFPDKRDELEDMVIFAEYSQDNYERVIAKCEERIARNPKDSLTCLTSYSTIGDCYHLLGETQKAFKAYDRALKVNPSYVPVLNNYAYYLALEGKMLGKALKMSRKTIEAEPDNATYLDTIGWILHLMRKDSEAKPYFKHAMLYGGKDSATMLAHYAIVLEALGESDLAEVYRKQARDKAAGESEK